MLFRNILLVTTATTTALAAGLFYGWSCSIVVGLSRLPDASYIQAMQTFNRAILNPVFFLTFMGTVFLLPLCTYLQFNGWQSPRFLFLLAATACYLIGVFGVTVVGNVPMNNALEAFQLQGASAEAITAQRLKFEQPWNTLNHIRTIAATISVILIALACLSPARD